MLDNGATDVVTGIRNQYIYQKAGVQYYCVSLIGPSNTSAFYFYISQSSGNAITGLTATFASGFYEQYLPTIQGGQAININFKGY